MESDKTTKCTRLGGYTLSHQGSFQGRHICLARDQQSRTYTPVNADQVHFGGFSSATFSVIKYTFDYISDLLLYLVYQLCVSLVVVESNSNVYLYQHNQTYFIAGAELNHVRKVLIALGKCSRVLPITNTVNTGSVLTDSYTFQDQIRGKQWVKSCLLELGLCIGTCQLSVITYHTVFLRIYRVTCPNLPYLSIYGASRFNRTFFAFPEMPGKSGD